MDPKMQATYDKVMGTQTPPQGPPAAQTPAPPVPTTNEVTASATAPTTTPTMPSNNNTTPGASPTPAYTQDNLNFQAAIQAPVAPTPVANQAVIAPQPKSSSSSLKFLYVIGIIVFFVAYTFLWIKIFNLPIPFLN